ncbi:hypothetical protein OSTOST_05986 [Ostertagia ostertagi]
MRSGHRRRRDRENGEQRAARQRADAERQRLSRESEGVEERRNRLLSDSGRHQQRRDGESRQERRARLSNDAERHRRERNRPSEMLEVALRERFAQSSYLGHLNYRCGNCGARHFLCEVKRQHPDLFLDALYGYGAQQRTQKNFMDNIRSFNSALAMASMGAQVDTFRGRGPYCYRIHGQVYHRIGPLHPQEGEERQYGQIYILDTEMAAQQRIGDVRNADCDPELMRFLSELISNINVYAQSFKMMSEVEQAEIALAERENRPPGNLRMVFEESRERGLLRRRYDIPTANEVAIEQNRLNFQRQNQPALRADYYRGLQDYVAGEDVNGPPGRRVILPSSYIGSPRSMHQAFQDAMAIVARFGKPTYFLTMTCNPQWKEIQENLFDGQLPSDRPDLTSRVFHAKLMELCSDLFKKHVLGEVQAYVYVIEFQKRGLPHCHMLLIMKERWKVRTPEECDRAVTAEIPNPETEPELHAAITSYMIHRRCGPADPQSPCMQSGSCSKRFPKPLRHHTSVEPDGYPLYRRRNRFPAEIHGVSYSDEWVVPTNPYLIMKYDCHINMEICGMISAVKYLYKYVYKGPDRANIQHRRCRRRMMR